MEINHIYRLDKDCRILKNWKTSTEEEHQSILKSLYELDDRFKQGSFVVAHTKIDDNSILNI